jgi:hypothetical protein
MADMLARFQPGSGTIYALDFQQFSRPSGARAAASQTRS